MISYLLSSLQSLFLPVQSVPAPICQLLYYTTVLFKVLYCKIKNVYFLCLCFLYIICVQSIIILLQYSTVLCSQLCQLGTQANIVRLRNKFYLQTCTQNGTCLYVEELLYIGVIDFCILTLCPQLCCDCLLIPGVFFYRFF